MRETFYRVHWSDAPAFSAANAWSALWGAERSEDGTQTKCVACDGTGTDLTDPFCRRCDGDGCTNCEDGAAAKCQNCDGTGWDDCQRGYSCFTDAESLIAYFTDPARSGVVGDDDKVVIFDGDYHGTGFDGEDLAVPARIIEEITWTEFLTRHS